MAGPLDPGRLDVLIRQLQSQPAWSSGTGAPVNSVGKIGDFYLDAAAGELYEKTAVATWTSRGTLT